MTVHVYQELRRLLAFQCMERSAQEKFPNHVKSKQTEPEQYIDRLTGMLFYVLHRPRQSFLDQWCDVLQVRLRKRMAEWAPPAAMIGLVAEAEDPQRLYTH